MLIQEHNFRSCCVCDKSNWPCWIRFKDPAQSTQWQIPIGWNRNARLYENWRDATFAINFSQLTCSMLPRIIKLSFQSSICWFSLQLQAFPVWYTADGGITGIQAICMQRTSCTQSTRCTCNYVCVSRSNYAHISMALSSHFRGTHTRDTARHGTAWMEGWQAHDANSIPPSISLIHLVSEISASVRRRMRDQGIKKRFLISFHALCWAVGCMNEKNTSHSKQSRKRIRRITSRRQHMLRSTLPYSSHRNFVFNHFSLDEFFFCSTKQTFLGSYGNHTSVHLGERIAFKFQVVNAKFTYGQNSFIFITSYFLFIMRYPPECISIWSEPRKSVNNWRKNAPTGIRLDAAKGMCSSKSTVNEVVLVCPHLRHSLVPQTVKNELGLHVQKPPHIAHISWLFLGQKVRQRERTNE